MANQDVNIRVSSNIAEALRLWKAMEEGPRGMANAIDDMHKKGSQGAKNWASGLDHVVGKWMSIHEGLEVAKKGLEQVIELQKEFNKLTVDTSKTVDAGGRQLFNQFGGKMAMEQISQRVLGVAARRNAGPNAAFAASQQLGKAGFSPEEATGASLNSLLESGAAANVPAGSMGEFAKGVGLFLKEAKMDQSAGGVRAVGGALYGLRGTNVGADDLGGFAKSATILHDKTGMGIGDQLALLAQVKDVSKDTGTAGAALARAAIAFSNPSAPQLAAAKGIGLGAADFGGDFFAFQQKAAAGIAGHSQAAANLFYKAMLGTRGQLAAGIFTPAGVSRTAALRAQARGGGMGQAAEVIEGGMAGKGEAAETREALAFYSKTAIDPETAKANVLADLKKRNVGWPGRTAAMTGFDFLAEEFGAETAISHAEQASAPFWEKKAATRERTESITNQSRADTIKIVLQNQNGQTIPTKAAGHRAGRTGQRNGGASGKW